MRRIIMMDTIIDPMGLHCSEFKIFTVNSLQFKGGKPFVPSHGTVCARILDQYIGEYELINIQMLPNENLGQGKSFGNIQAFKEALDMSIEHNADIVSISAASSLLSDSSLIYEKVKELSRQSIVVAALDNHGFISLPASYPFVMGVQADRKGYLDSGELAYCKEDPLGAGFYASCDAKVLNELRYRPSNSFAVPVAVAWCSHIMEQGKDVEQEISNMSKYPGNSYTENTSPWILETDTIPFILFSSLNPELSCRTIMDILHKNFRVQATALSCVGASPDIRIRKIVNAEKIEEEVRFMEQHYKTDLIFILTHIPSKDVIKEKVKPDLIISEDSNGFWVCGEKERVYVPEDKVAESIYRLLS